VAALTAAQDRVKELTDQLSDEKDRHKDTAIELATAEAQQSMAALELEQLRSVVESLTKELAAKRRSWWQRITNR